MGHCAFFSFVSKTWSCGVSPCERAVYPHRMNTLVFQLPWLQKVEGNRGRWKAGGHNPHKREDGRNTHSLSRQGTCSKSFLKGNAKNKKEEIQLILYFSRFFFLKLFLIVGLQFHFFIIVHEEGKKKYFLYMHPLASPTKKRKTQKLPLTQPPSQGKYEEWIRKRCNTTRTIQRLPGGTGIQLLYSNRDRCKAREYAFTMPIVKKTHDESPETEEKKIGSITYAFLSEPYCVHPSIIHSLKPRTPLTIQEGDEKRSMFVRVFGHDFRTLEGKTRIRAEALPESLQPWIAFCRQSSVVGHTREYQTLLTWLDHRTHSLCIPRDENVDERFPWFMFAVGCPVYVNIYPREGKPFVTDLLLFENTFAMMRTMCVHFRWTAQHEDAHAMGLFVLIRPLKPASPPTDPVEPLADVQPKEDEEEETEDNDPLADSSSHDTFG